MKTCQLNLPDLEQEHVLQSIQFLEVYCAFDCKKSYSKIEITGKLPTKQYVKRKFYSSENPRSFGFEKNSMEIEFIRYLVLLNE